MERAPVDGRLRAMAGGMLLHRLDAIVSTGPWPRKNPAEAGFASEAGSAQA